MSETTYQITRRFRDDSCNNYTVDEGLTLAEAQEHCSDPDTSSSTCGPEGDALTEEKGPWFDSYDEE